MKTSTKVLIITLVCAIPAFLLGNVLWPASTEIAPTSTQLPFFIILAAVEAITFGLGVSFVVLSWNRMQSKPLVFFAIAWLLISWWPHDNMHKHNGLDLNGLLVIEYLFHVTLIVCAYIVAHDFWKRLRLSSEIR